MNLLSKIEQYLDGHKEFALITVVSVTGSTPREIGAKMLVFKDGTIEGTIGGGKVEHDAIKDAQEFICKRTSGLKEYFLDKKHGLLCGGNMKVFIETFSAPRKLIIFGAGHIGQALYKLAVVLDFEITIIDQRKEFAKKQLFPEAKKILSKQPLDAIKELTIDQNTYIVIVTHGHEHDYAILKNVIKVNAAYIGMIGSKTKVKGVFEKLRSEGVAQNLIKKVYAPIGLAIGGDSPQEIALSILAEVILVNNNRSLVPIIRDSRSNLSSTNLRRFYD